jgi:hypothetical protein
MEKLLLALAALALIGSVVYLNTETTTQDVVP